MFEGINRIDWDALGNHNVPRYLNELVSDNLSTRGQAYKSIMETIVDAEAGFENANVGLGLSKILTSDLQL